MASQKTPEDSDKTFNKFAGTNSYIADQELLNAVNVAIALEKPLIIRGEPGTGKTMLAKAIASGLGLDLIPWHVKSTTKAQDGLYHYDAVQRLNDSRFENKDVNNIENYIQLGPLGTAFTKEARSVLLIDEVDKADIEFPNDLLHELDSMSFYICETQTTISAKDRPIVIITSNNEKELPDAFLRRCIFHFIRFPEEGLMHKIVDVHHPNVQQKLIEDCLKKFYWIRNLPAVRKKPSTSELIDWINALIAGGISVEDMKNKIPFLGTLIKKEGDLDAFSMKSDGRVRF